MIDAVASIARQLPYFRGKAKLIDTLVPRGGTRRASVFGFQMTLDLSERIQRQIWLGCYDPCGTVVIRRLLKQGSIFVDVGANVGYFTALAASIVGTTGRVLSFEPSPYAFCRLSRAVPRQTRSVTALNIGLSDHDGELKLFVPPRSYGNHDPSVVEYCDGMSPIVVPVRRLGALLRDMRIGCVDVLKVDVEGHEPEVFAGCADTIRAGNVRAVFCEFNDPLLRKREYSSYELLNYLRELGYRVHAVPPLDGKVVNLLLQRPD
jgi:FkbM family methyltransferase